MQRIAVLASGRGSNLEALHAYLGAREAAPEGRGAIAFVVTDRPNAGALEVARARGIETAALDARGTGLDQLLQARRIDLVVLAGYLSLVPGDVVRAYRGRLVNVHPALLPAFGGRGMYGARVHRAVLAAQARVSGVTVHFVDEEYDHGATIAQWPVPVFADDTPETLAARVHRVEHALFPRAVGALLDGRVRLDAQGRARWGAGPEPDRKAFVLDPVEDDALVRTIDAALR